MQKNDIVRPNGDVVVKASGKRFENHICFVLNINEEGFITKIQEYYNKAWDNGVHMDKYTRMSGDPQRPHTK